MKHVIAMVTVLVLTSLTVPLFAVNDSIEKVEVPADMIQQPSKPYLRLSTPEEQAEGSGEGFPSNRHVRMLDVDPKDYKRIPYQQLSRLSPGEREAIRKETERSHKKQLALFITIGVMATMLITFFLIRKK